LQETHCSEDKEHEEFSSSETGTEKYQNGTEQENEKTTSASQKTL
jgi:hypothetical protein